jgi:hypothetical protein
MPARAPYIPRKQVDFNTWANQFARTVLEKPERFALAAAAVEEIEAAVADWNAAFQSATMPSMKTCVTVRTKNDARKEALATLRGYAQQIANSKSVDPGDKLVLGVNPGDSKWTRIAPPSSWPCLSIFKASELRLTFRYVNSDGGEKVQAKPYGVAFCQICYGLRPLHLLPAARITNRAELTEQIAATRSPVIIDFPSSAGGQQCYLSAYWLLRNGQRGPWGPITSFTVPTAG